jgi:Uma2 family endonuclease
LITSALDVTEHDKGLPADLVHTVVEVVSPSNGSNDRVLKKKIYAEAGIPCYWRIEQRSWREHRGPVPAIVVSLRDKAGDWHQTTSVAGGTSELPVVIDADGTTVMVTIDPAILAGRRPI